MVRMENRVFTSRVARSGGWTDEFHWKLESRLMDGME